MKKRSIIILFSIILLLILSTATLAQEDSTACVYYFYGKDCEACLTINSLISELEDKYQDAKIETYEVYFDINNSILLSNFYENYDIDKGSRDIPAAFIGSTYFIGADAISNFLEERMLTSTDSNCPSKEAGEVFGIIGAGEPSDVFAILSFIEVSKSALSNSFSSAGLVLLLLFFILTLAIIKHDHKTREEDESKIKVKKEHLWKMFTAYLLTLFILNLLISFGLFSVKSFLDKTLIFNYIIAIITLIITIVGIKRFFFDEKFLSHLFSKLKPAYQKLVHAIIHPIGTVIVAAIATLYTLPGITGHFELIVHVMSNSTKPWAGLPFFIWHSIIFFIPLTIVFLATYWQLTKIDEKSGVKLQDHGIKLLAFFMKVIMFILATIVLFLK